jgi:hypothetical protein
MFYWADIAPNDSWQISSTEFDTFNNSQLLQLLYTIEKWYLVGIKTTHPYCNIEHLNTS